MVVEYGMSDLGPINYGPTIDVTEWGKSYFEQNSVSQEMMAKIDKEIKKIIDQAYTQAQKIIKEKKSLLDKVATALLKKESLDGDEFEKIVGKKHVNTLTR
jgi:cell division protease FtsH